MKPFCFCLSILLFFASAATAATADQRTCYFIDTSVAIDDMPCSKNGKVTTTCCSKNDICLDNGLCYLQGSDGPAISRGSCTDKDWRGTCAGAAPCKAHNPQTGYRVVNARGNRYCCGRVDSIEGNNISCAVDSDFYVRPGKVIPGVAALSSYINSTSGNADGSSQSKRLAIGLGLGIPLGIIAGTALFWGLWERKQKVVSERQLTELKASTGIGMAGNDYGQSQGYGYGYPQGQVQPQGFAHGEAQVVRPVELDNATPPSELGPK